METVCLKMEESLLKEIDSKLTKYRYSTRTEFIRDAIRLKLTDLQKQEMLLAVDKAFGSSKLKTTDEDLHRAREQLAKEWGAQ